MLRTIRGSPFVIVWFFLVDCCVYPKANDAKHNPWLRIWVCDASYDPLTMTPHTIHGRWWHVQSTVTHAVYSPWQGQVIGFLFPIFCSWLRTIRHQWHRIQSMAIVWYLNFFYLVGYCVTSFISIPVKIENLAILGSTSPVKERLYCLCGDGY